jgi:hypothetical protein
MMMKIWVSTVSVVALTSFATLARAENATGARLDTAAAGKPATAVTSGSQQAANAEPDEQLAASSAAMACATPGGCRDQNAADGSLGSIEAGDPCAHRVMHQASGGRLDPNAAK